MNDKHQTTIVFETFWKFAAERQRIFHLRASNSPGPWTDDPILAKHKFTNAYRAADRVSQFLIKEVIYKGDQDPEEVLFRILLFKVFNKIETWKQLVNSIGEVSWKAFDFEKYRKILGESKKSSAIYSAAYIMASPKVLEGNPCKHENHLWLLKTMFENGFAEKVRKCTGLNQLYSLLLSYKGFGNFLAMQYAIDINYSEVVDFDENEFIIPGPGCLRGIRKCWVDDRRKQAQQVIKELVDKQDYWFDHFEIDFKNLFGRPLHLIDIQNLFCETDKYSRVAHPEIDDGGDGRNTIKQLFKPISEPIELFFPPKWGI